MNHNTERTVIFDDVEPVHIEDTAARKGLCFVWELPGDRFGICDEITGHLIDASTDRNSVLERLTELRRGRG